MGCDDHNQEPENPGEANDPQTRRNIRLRDMQLFGIGCRRRIVRVIPCLASHRIDVPARLIRIILGIPAQQPCD
jgi:hypothetical protein